METHDASTRDRRSRAHTPLCNPPARTISNEHPVQPARIVGVIGAGTMGAGIAQLAARSGARTILHDPLPEALERGAQYARDGLGKEAAKGRLSAAEADAAAARIEPVDELAAFAPCELVIEAAPERLALKHELYARLSEEIVGARVRARD